MFHHKMSAIKTVFTFLDMKHLKAYDTLLRGRLISNDDLRAKLWFVLSGYAIEIMFYIGNVGSFRAFINRMPWDEMENAVLELLKETNGMTPPEYHEYVLKVREYYRKHRQCQEHYTC